MRRDGTGTCESCAHEFGYMLIHNGFNDTAFGYCDRCGMTAFFGAYSARTPKEIVVGFHGPMTSAAEKLADPYECGRHFRGTTAPRCPHCHETLSAEKAADYIERNAPGTAKGWRWQKSWSGLYA